MISRRMFLAIAGGATLSSRRLWSADLAPAFPPMLDHILLGCSDLDKGMAFVEQHTGVRPAMGGVHPGRGTRNALLSLGEMHYLEIIAPDPAQASLTAASPSMLYKLRHMDQPRIVTWAVHTGDIEGLAEKLRKARIAFEGPTPGSRKRPDGRLLNWQTLNLDDDQNGLLPFFIQWGADSLHPSIDAPPGCRLGTFEAASAEPDKLGRLFQHLEIAVRVEKAAQSQLRADISGPRGSLKLSS